MGKQSKKKKLKALQYEVMTLRVLLSGFMEFVGYDSQVYKPIVKPVNIEPFQDFQKELRDTESKYALKAS
jgi:hypothetical protein